MNHWDQILKYLQQNVSRQNYDNWLSGTTFLAVEGDTMFVSAPDRETRAWLDTEYAGLIQSAIRALGLPVKRVSFESQAPAGKTNQAMAAVEPVVEGDCRVTALNPKFTFGSFVVGACNQFAAAAAKSVAENPSRSYNPLFLYGGGGVGKKHPMHAVGGGIAGSYATMRGIYTFNEKVNNEKNALLP